MNSTLNVPSRIRVGFKERQGTYTGKLAYVIYYDVKGKIRKEKSWEGWRDKSIEPEEYDNVPTDGFVLNKAVGGVRRSYGWNARNEYTRVYDPRGFEFEISVANLLFILQECSSIKGKGLEGEFAYAWNGTELILLPVAAEEYQQSLNYTNIQTNKVSAKSMVVGATYFTKDNRNVMYMGRHICFLDISKHYSYHHIAPVKKHVFSFYDSTTTGQKRYWLQTGFTKLSHCTSSEPIEQYAGEYEKLMLSSLLDPPASLDTEDLILIDDFPERVHYIPVCIIINNRYMMGSIDRVYDYYDRHSDKNKFNLKIHHETIVDGQECNQLSIDTKEFDRQCTEEEVRGIVKKLYLITESGNRVRLWGGHHKYEKK